MPQYEKCAPDYRVIRMAIEGNLTDVEKALEEIEDSDLEFYTKIIARNVFADKIYSLRKALTEIDEYLESH